jgi:predicted MPP superfamily phosphohydrolase
VQKRRLLLIGAVAALMVAALAIAFLLGTFTRSSEAPSPAAGIDAPAIADAPLVRIAVAGDTGTGDASQRATAEQMTTQANTNGPYDALLLLGDLVYADGDAELVDEAVTQPFADLLDDGTVLVPVLGNHDYRSNEQADIMAALGHERTWYVQRIGPVRIIVLDTERTEDPQQTQWLRKTLATRVEPDTWTIVATHKPAYSAGQHGSDENVQAQWAPLFAEYDIPLVISGHDHDYQRSKPIDGVTYLVSGAGAKVRPTGHADFTAVSAATRHYLDLRVYEQRILVRAIDQSGALLDTFTISR